MIPKVTINVRDGGLGVVTPAGNGLAAIVGTSSSGTAAVPILLSKASDAVTEFGQGPLAKMCQYILARTGRPVLACKCDVGTASSIGTADESGFAGTATTVFSGTPNDEYEILVDFISGGTVGTAGITYRVSLDGGRTFGNVTALGTGTTIACGLSGVTLTLGTGTVVTGDVVEVATSMPVPSITDALQALSDSAVKWDVVAVANTVTAALAEEVDSFVEAEFVNRPCSGIVSAQGPATRGSASAESTYRSTLQAAFAGVSTTSISICAGYQKIVDGGANPRRPVAWSALARDLSVGISTDLAAVSLGALAGVSIRDSHGNRDEHDELLDPGLDDLGFLTLRTFHGRNGVYITNPRIMAPSGSDFIYRQYRKVVNQAAITIKEVLEFRLSQGLRLSALGTISEQEAAEIEALCGAALRTTIMSAPHASSVSFVLSRTDNILSTGIISGDLRIVPLGYAKEFSITISLSNPALGR